MSNFLKQSTAVVISFGPAVDKGDGVTEETGLVSALDHGTTGIKLSKNGGALTIRHASVTATTYDAYGMYRVTLDTTDTNTVGTLRMAFNEAATCLPVWQDFMVLPANVFDSLVSGSDALDVSAIQFSGQTITASGGVTIPAATLASTTNITAGTITTVTNLTNAPTNGDLTATMKASVTAAVPTAAGIADAVWDEAITDHVAPGKTANALNDADTVINNIYSGGDYDPAISTVIAVAVWDEALAGHVAAGSTGKKLSDISTGTPLDAAGVRTAVGLASANLDTQIATLATPTNITAATGIDITKILGTAISTPATAGILDVNVKNIGNGAVDMFSTGVPLVGLTGGDIGGLGFLAGATIGAVSGHTPQTGDSFARLGAPAGASVSADIAAIQTKTVNLPAAPAAVGDIPTAAAIADANWDEALSGHLTAGTTGKALSDAGAAGTPLDAAGVRAAIGLASANLDTQLAALPTAAENAAATWSDDPEAYAVGQAGNTLFTLGEQVPLDAAGVRAAIGLASANLDTQLGAIDDYLDTEVAAIKAKTDLIPAAPASTTNITGGVITTVTNLTNAPTNGDLTATMKTSVTTAATAATPTAAAVTGAVGSVTGTVGSVTGNVGGNVGGNVTGTVGSVVGAVGSVTGDVGGNVVGSVASVVGAVGSLTTNNDKTGYALTSAERNAVSDALLDRADAIATGITTRQALEIAIAVLAGKLSGAATATITIRDVADTKNVVVATTDASGNRTAVTITP